MHSAKDNSNLPSHTTILGFLPSSPVAHSFPPGCRQSETTWAVCPIMNFCSCRCAFSVTPSVAAGYTTSPRTVYRTQPLVSKARYPCTHSSCRALSSGRLLSVGGGFVGTVCSMTLRQGCTGRKFCPHHRRACSRSQCFCSRLS